MSFIFRNQQDNPKPVDGADQKTLKIFATYNVRS